MLSSTGSSSIIISFNILVESGRGGAQAPKARTSPAYAPGCVVVGEVSIDGCRGRGEVCVCVCVCVCMCGG